MFVDSLNSPKLRALELFNVQFGQRKDERSSSMKKSFQTQFNQQFMFVFMFPKHKIIIHVCYHCEENKHLIALRHKK